MNEALERSAKRMFVKKLETVSTELAVWAQGKLFVSEWSIKDVKQHLRNAMTVCETGE